MKRILSALILATAATAAATPALADVGVSVSVGQPGFFGRIDIGDYYPAPALVYPQPLVIQPVPVLPPPIYLHVPPGHAKNWARYCRRYDACGRPVYFVQDRWYNDVYVPRYRERHYGPGGYDRRGDRDGRDDRRGHDRRDHDRGRGDDDRQGNGHGYGRGRD